MPEMDLSELDALQARIGKNRPCPVCKALGELTGNDLAVLEAALTDEYTPGVGAAFLERRGYRVNVNQVSSHKRGTGQHAA